MLVVVQSQYRLTRIDLSNTISGSFQIYCEQLVLAHIHADQNKWKLCAEKDVFINQKDKETHLKEDTFYVLHYLAERVILYVEKNTQFCFHKYVCQKDFSIGRSMQCNIQYENPFVSHIHAMITFQQQRFYLKDQQSSNYTYVNGERFNEGFLNVGDIIFIMGFQMILGAGFWSIKEEKNYPFHLSEIFQPYVYIEKVPIKKERTQIPSGYRPAPEFKPLSLTIKEQDQYQETQEEALWISLGPAFFMGVISLLNVIVMVQRTTTQDLFSILPSLLMSMSILFTACLFPLLRKRYQSKKRNISRIQQDHDYQLYLQDIQHQVNSKLQEETKYLAYVFPSLKELCQQKSYGYTTYQDFHYLKLRIGQGDREASIQIEGVNKIQTLLSKVPIYIDISSHYIMNVLGPFHKTHSFVEQLLLTLCVTHHRDNLRMACIGKHMNPRLRWLPHLDYLHMHCFIETAQAALEFQDALRIEYEQRKERPALLICLFDNSFNACIPFLEQIKKESYQNISLLTCSAIKDRYAQISIDVEHQEYQTREDMEPHDIEFDAPVISTAIYRFLLNTTPFDNVYKTPAIYPFLSMFSAYTVEELNIWKRWEQHASYKTLATPIGLRESGQLLCLNIHEKEHGPHGLIAGMTGSGKSECITTYLMSMAVNYHPDDVQFLIIDYKGGGLAKLFEPLPHTAGIITNLEESSLERVFISIQSEVLRRQRILKETAVQFQKANLSINDYQKLFYQHQTDISLSHLIIVCDEFAELKMQQPMYMDQLISTARIGRSLGIHLILATQKPSGIVNDQIWSNTRFHLCMKVADKADSMDMIHCSDSAYLNKSGEFYLQIGNNEAFMKGLSAWVQAPYRERYKAYQDLPIKVLSNTKKVECEISLHDISSTQEKSQFEKVMEHILACSNKETIHKYQIWKPPLVDNKPLFELEKNYTFYKDSVLIGEVDDPISQSYQGLYLCLHTHAILYANKDVLQFFEILCIAYSHFTHTMKIICIDMIQELSECFQTNTSAITYIKGNETNSIKNFFEQLKERKLKNVYVIIHGISIFEKTYGYYNESFHEALKEAKQQRIYFMITAQHEEEIAFRLRNYFTQTFVLYMENKEELRSILNGKRKIIDKDCQGKGFWSHGSIHEFQLACVN